MLLALPMHSVVVQCPRMGGGFGGKETQAATFAALAALAASKTGRKVRVRLNRDQDMMITGKRHPFLAKFHVGYDRDGLLLAAKIDIYSNGGWSLDLVASGDRSRGLSSRQRLLHSARRVQRARRENQSRVEHGVSRIRRTAGNAGHRGNHGSHCAASSVCRRKSCAGKTYIAAAARPTRRITARRSRTTGSSGSGRS